MKTLLLIWNRGNKNLWDELILVWTLKMLLEKKENIFSASSDFLPLDVEKAFERKIWDFNYDKIIIPTSDISFSQSFLANFFTQDQLNKIQLVKELPHWIRSFFKFLPHIKDLKKYFQADDLMVGWGEIFTDRWDGSGGWYFLVTALPFFIKKLFGKAWKVILTGWIDTPQRWFNKILFPWWLSQSDEFYLRDFNSIEVVSSLLYQKYFKFNLSKYFEKIKNLHFMFDTSKVAFDRDIFQKQKGPKHHLVGININPIGWQKYKTQYLDYVEQKIAQWNKIVYIPFNLAQDSRFFEILKEKFGSNRVILSVDWSKDFVGFIRQLLELDEILATRLHLFLIATYMDLQVISLPYQNKVKKFQAVLRLYNLFK